MRHALVFNVVSLITFVLAVFFIISKGLHLSVEFTGGTVLEINYAQAPQLDPIRQGLDKAGFQDSQVQNFGTSRDIIIRVPNSAIDKSAALSNSVFDAICKTSDGTVTTQTVLDNKGLQVPQQVCSSAQKTQISAISSVQFVGPQVGKELAEDGSMALLLVVIGIVIYLAIRFEWRFAVSAIIANLHDVVIIVGFFAFFQWEFSLPVLAAVLAVLGYSVNESVVVFDRVRETFRNSRMRGFAVPQVLDHAITSTISRTIITHGCTQMMVLSMLIFGGPTLHYFALALTIGICFGIYSSVLVASPLVMWLGVSREQFIKPVKTKEEAVV